MLRQMQSLRQKADLTALLNSLLENIYTILEADFAVMLVPGNGNHLKRVDLSKGNYPAQARPFVDGLLQGVLTSGEPVLLGDLAGDPAGDPHATGAQIAFGRAIALTRAVGAGRDSGGRPEEKRLPGAPHNPPANHCRTGSPGCTERHLIAELEYKTMMQERARLAREIHDGLAQTLGFLKLQAAQMRT